MPYENFLTSVSSPRSGVYRRVFRTQNEVETCGAILWGQQVTMSLLSLTSNFEVALRNRIHVSLSRQASSKLNAQSSDSFPWYDKELGWFQLNGESLEKVERILSANQLRLKVQPPPDKVISRLSFGFWSNILDSQLPGPIAARTFPEILPHHPSSKHHWKHVSNQKVVVDIIKSVQTWRNRLAHCKPVWNEGWFRSSPNQHWTELLPRLKQKHNEVLDCLSWICPATCTVYKDSFAGKIFPALVSEEAIVAHLQAPTTFGVSPIFAAPTPQEIAAYKARR